MLETHNAIVEISSLMEKSANFRELSFLLAALAVGIAIGLEACNEQKPKRQVAGIRFLATNGPNKQPNKK